MNIKKLLAFSALLSAILLTACGKKDDAPSAATTQPASAKSSVTVPSLERRSAGSRSYSLIDMTWDTLPNAEFEKVRSQIRDLYWSGAAKNPEKLAKDFSPAYRREVDSFKKADMVKSMAAELDQHYANAQKIKDYSVRVQSSEVSTSIFPYDAAIGGFKIGFNSNQERGGVGMIKDSDRSVNHGRWFVRFVGVPDKKELIYKPRDEAEARDIESNLASLRDAAGGQVYVDAVFSGSVAGTLYNESESADTAIFTVDTISFIGKKSTKTLFTIGAKELGLIEPSCQSTRQALKIPEPKSTDTSSMGGMYASSQTNC